MVQRLRPSESRVQTRLTLLVPVAVEPTEEQKAPLVPVAAAAVQRFRPLESVLQVTASPLPVLPLLPLVAQNWPTVALSVTAAFADDALAEAAALAEEAAAAAFPEAAATAEDAFEDAAPAALLATEPTALSALDPEEQAAVPVSSSAPRAVASTAVERRDVAIGSALSWRSARRAQFRAQGRSTSDGRQGRPPPRALLRRSGEPIRGTDPGTARRTGLLFSGPPAHTGPMLSLQEISDRLEIQDLMVRYAHAVDTRDWPLFRAVFTEDATVDYTAFGGPVGSVDEVVEFLSTVLPLFGATQHLVANCAIELEREGGGRGDRATVRTMCHNPMALPAEAGKEAGVLVCGLWYRDTVVRTPEGWRIGERAEDRAYQITLGQS